MSRPPVSRPALTSAFAALLTILASAGCTPPDADPGRQAATQTASVPSVNEFFATPSAAPSPDESPAPLPADEADTQPPPDTGTVAGTSTLPLPPEAFNPDIDGTLPVIDHFLNAWRGAYVGGDTAPLLDISADDCALCNDVATLAQSYASDGSTGAGGDITASSARRAARTDIPAQGWRMDLVMDAIAFDSPDGVNHMVGGFSDHVFIGLVWEDERWLVSEVTSLGASDAQSTE